MASPVKAPRTTSESSSHNYSLADVLRDRVNRSHRRLDILSFIQGALLLVATLLAIIALLL